MPQLKIEAKFQGVFINNPVTQELLVDADRVVVQKADPETGELIKLTLAQLFRLRTLNEDTTVDDFDNYVSTQILSKHPNFNRLLDVNYQLIE